MTLPLAEIKRLMENVHGAGSKIIADESSYEHYTPDGRCIGYTDSDDCCMMDALADMANAMPAIISRLEALERVAEEARIVVSRERADETYGGDVMDLEDALSALDKEAGK